ncbi:L [Glarea lozoyensis ATCC 20868]|uniref:L n=1 Tax=Glarea lozoyensis (strain ATCC 20868 / MF5171) TaxID=1116229 RepID=S3DC47_GLAL2|nr:L [Glarea lozoyensis ATCC 20868] [Glarea lozoyensis ATCC 20868]EPE29576.1 L [Glarea lozoyensis ATCC 20868] [Glarea lozoyensis ATCC 20868]
MKPGYSNLGTAAPWLLWLAAVPTWTVAAEISCTQQSRTITTQAEADALSSCVNVTGTIIVESQSLTQLTLNGIERVDNLQISSSPLLVDVSAPALYWINHNFTISDVRLLSNLSLPSLSTAAVDTLSWINVPNLVQPVLRKEADQYGNVGANIYGDLIISSSGIQDLDFFNFGTFNQAQNVRIVSNKDLRTINLTTLEEAQSIHIASNGPNMIVDLPALSRANSLSLEGVSVVSVPRLTKVDGNFVLSGNSFERFAAPAFNGVAGDIHIEDNELLSDLSLPMLTEVGGGLSNGSFTVANNPGLKSLNLERLGGGTEVGASGAIDGNASFSGNFETVYMPRLIDYTAGFHIATTHADFNCTPFDRLSYSPINKGSRKLYSCSGIALGSTTDTAIHYSQSKGSLLPKGAMAIIIIIGAVAGLGAVAYAYRCFHRRRIAQRQLAPTQPSLADMGVMLPGIRVPRQHEDGDGIEMLPEYSRHGKPGEVPPKYDDNAIYGGPPPGAPPPAVTKSFFTNLVRLSNWSRRGGSNDGPGTGTSGPSAV